MNSSKVIISVENYNLNTINGVLLNSPRSLEACKREGILPQELIKPSFDEFKVTNRSTELNAQGLEMQYQHLDHKRQELFRDVINERRVVIEEEKLGLWNADGVHRSTIISKYQSQMDQGGSSMIEKERQQLEKIKIRQQKEIEQMMDQEMKTEEIRNQNELKLKQSHDRDVQREHELAIKKQDQDEQKHLRDQLQKDKTDEETKKQAERMEELRKKESQRESNDQERLRQKDQERKEKEEERKQIQEAQKKVSDLNLKKQQDELDKKKDLLEIKAQQRKEVFEQLKINKSRQSEIARRQQDEKTKSAKDKNETDLIKVREEYEKKQLITEQKKTAYEEDKRKKMEESRKQAQEHTILIKRVIKLNEENEHLKKQEYLKRVEEVENRKQQIEVQQGEILEQKKYQETHKEQQRKQIVVNQDHQLQLKVSEFQRKFAEKDEIVQKIQTKKLDQQSHKKNQDVIMRLDRRQNVERRIRKQEYQKQILQDKINEKMDRATRIQQDMGSLLVQRQEARKEIDKQKREIVQKLEKVKEGKMHPSELTKDLNQSRMLNNSQQSQNQSTYKAPPNGADRKSVELTKIKEQESDQKAEQKQKGYSDLKVKHNQDMLKVLEEEQNAEIQRDVQLNGCQNEEERQKLEKPFGIERAKAQLRIQKISDQHHVEQNKFRLKHNTK